MRKIRFFNLATAMEESALVVGQRKDGKICVLTDDDELAGWFDESEVTFL